MLADSIRLAHREAPGSWVVTVTAGGIIHLDVGQVLVLSFRDARVDIYVARGQAPVRPPFRVERFGSRGSVYARSAVPIPVEVVTGPAAKLPSVSRQVIRAHGRLITAAALAKRLSPWKTSFSLEVLTEVEAILRTKLPRPAYSAEVTSGGGRMSPLPDLDESAVTDDEGRRRLHEHLRRERSRWLVEQKKKFVVRQVGRLRCEICGFDFAEHYGALGRDFCEVHHTKPLATMNGVRRVPLSDLAIVCSNCHRMIHRSDPPNTMAAMKRLVARVRSDS
jgi:hypothetical protein